MREMIERWGMGVVELKRSDGNGAIANGSVVGIGFDALRELLLREPKITAAARILAGLQDVSRDF